MRDRLGTCPHLRRNNTIFLLREQTASEMCILSAASHHEAGKFRASMIMYISLKQNVTTLSQPVPPRDVLIL
jgi:hypothetical protein